jgi:hypothetical protein
MQVSVYRYSLPVSCRVATLLCVSTVPKEAQRDLACSWFDASNCPCKAVRSRSRAATTSHVSSTGMCCPLYQSLQDTDFGCRIKLHTVYTQRQEASLNGIKLGLDSCHSFFARIVSLIRDVCLRQRFDDNAVICYLDFREKYLDLQRLAAIRTFLPFHTHAPHSTLTSFRHTSHSAALKYASQYSSIESLELNII